MQNNFRVCKELVFFDLWAPDSGLQIQGFRFRFPVADSGFWLPCFRVAPDKLAEQKAATCGKKNTSAVHTNYSGSSISLSFAIPTPAVSRRSTFCVRVLKKTPQPISGF